MYNKEKLNALLINDVAERLGIQIKKNTALCFLHSEKTPSLKFNKKANMWKCFGCNEGGTVITLVMKKADLSFVDACAWLNNEFLGETSSNSIMINQRIKIKHKPILNATKEQNFCDFELYDDIVKNLKLSDKDYSYLTIDRALTPEVVEINNIKSIPNISNFYSKLQQKFGDQRLFNAGLLKISETGKYRRTWWEGGILFPYYNYAGKIGMLQLRPYKPFPSANKYLMLSDVNTCMYNEKLLAILPANSNLYICEGAPDTLSMLSKGLNSVGVPGVGTFKNTWIELIGKFNIFIVFDNDDSGKHNAKTLNDRLVKYGITTHILPPGKYHDVNEMLVAERNNNNE